jgi:hypothetical protein
MNKKASFKICPEINACSDRGEFCIWLDTRVGILGDQPLGSFVLPNRLTGAVCHRFLLWIIYQYSGNTFLFIKDNTYMWLIHDGAPPNFLCIVRQHLNQTFNEQWIGRGGPVNWRAWSPDLYPLDFWLWGHLDFDVLNADQWFGGITATSRECLSGDSSETRNFRQSAHLCATKIWKLN